MADSNPFGDPEGVNPFADPAVIKITGPEQQTTRAVLDSYNPFSDDKNKSTASRRDETPSTNVTIPPPQPAAPPTRTERQPPAYNQSSAQSATDDLIAKQQELERKAAEIARREHELNNTQFNTRRNNFPPLPEKCCVHPCFYQDIGLEIPLQFQRMVRIVFYLWMIYSLTLAVNVIAALAYMIASLSGQINNSSAATFGLSILWLILFVPCSFVCWFRPAYKAFRSDSSFNFFLYFFIFFCQFIATVIQAIGIDGMGSCGWLVAIIMVTKNAGAGVIMIIVAVAFTTLAVLDIITLIKIHQLYRSTGASFAKAQQEFRSDVIGSTVMQDAAGDMASSAARSAMTGQPGNRF